MSKEISNLTLARYVSLTGGILKYMKTFKSLTVNDTGSQQDISSLAFEASKTYVEHCLLINVGVEKIYIAFDKNASEIDTTNETTYNFILDENGSSINDRIIFDGVFLKLAYKCEATKTSALRLVIW